MHGGRRTVPACRAVVFVVRFGCDVVGAGWIEGVRCSSRLGLMPRGERWTVRPAGAVGCCGRPAGIVCNGGLQADVTGGCARLGNAAPCPVGRCFGSRPHRPAERRPFFGDDCGRSHRACGGGTPEITWCPFASRAASRVCGQCASAALKNSAPRPCSKVESRRLNFRVFHHNRRDRLDGMCPRSEHESI